MALCRIINATGVILHTGAGRAPFGGALLVRASALLASYVNLEIDMVSGERSQRDAHVADALRDATGADDALVVNNNAAAVLLALRVLGNGGYAAASRGQLVEIGGSFRLPEVMAAGGVTLKAVGTVNVTTVEDYRRALADGAALVVLAHRSNFYPRGRFAEPSVDEVVDVAAAFGRPVLYDLGSGLLSASLYPGIISDHEPAVDALVAAGVDVVCFSGDKLLGGPQAGIAVGKADVVGAMRRDAMYRALRAGKETYAFLTAVLEAYRAGGERRREVPVYRLLTRGESEVETLAGEVLTYLREARVPGLTAALAGDESLVGGGSVPHLRLPTTVVALRHDRRLPHSLGAALRRLAPPLLARVTGDAVHVDPRSLLEEDIPFVREAVKGLGAALT